MVEHQPDIRDFKRVNNRLNEIIYIWCKISTTAFMLIQNKIGVFAQDCPIVMFILFTPMPLPAGHFTTKHRAPLPLVHRHDDSTRPATTNSPFRIEVIHISPLAHSLPFRLLRRARHLAASNIYIDKIIVTKWSNRIRRAVVLVYYMSNLWCES